MPGEDGQQFVEDARAVEAEAGLHGEFHAVGADGVAQGAEDGVHARGFAQESAAGAFAVHDGAGQPRLRSMAATGWCWSSRAARTSAGMSLPMSCAMQGGVRWDSP